MIFRQKNIIFLTGILLFFGYFNLVGQEIKDIYSIRNFNNSLAVSVGEKENESFYTGAYGNIRFSTQQSEMNRYLYTAQEYDSQLSMHLFPSRFYSYTTARFITPDPKSQYHSPYLFVSGDPVNFIDLDGNSGKALFLYAEDHRPKSNFMSYIDNMKQTVPDAHYVPMSKFINNEVGDLPEWNGNVFILGHMGTEEASEIEIEKGPEIEDIEVDSPFSRAKFSAPEGSWKVTYDGDEMGRLLRTFSEERGVPIKSIVAGGCQGAGAAESIKYGFLGKSSPRFGANKIPISFAGVKKGRIATLKPSSDASGFATNYTTRDISELTMSDQKGIKASWGKLKKKYLQKKPHIADSEEIGEMVNGRIPLPMQSEFEFFHGAY